MGLALPGHAAAMAQGRWVLQRYNCRRSWSRACCIIVKRLVASVEEKVVISTSGALASFPFQIDSLWHAFLAQASTVRVSRGQRVTQAEQG